MRLVNILYLTCLPIELNIGSISIGQFLGWFESSSNPSEHQLQYLFALMRIHTLELQHLAKFYVELPLRWLTRQAFTVNK